MRSVSTPCYWMPLLKATEGEAWHAGKGAQRVSESPSPRLANFLPEHIRHAPRPEDLVAVRLNQGI